MHGISFETLPSVWSDKSIFPALTYSQCVELEGYWDKYHGAGTPPPPIPYDSWVKYFAQDGEAPPCRWTLKNIIKNWRNAKAKYHKNGLPNVFNRADSKAVHEKMLQYHQHAMIAIAAASPAIIIEDVKKIEDDAHQSQAGSRQLDVLDHAPLAADLSPVGINADRGSEKKSLLLNENKADDNVECRINLMGIGSSEPKLPSLLNLSTKFKGLQRLPVSQQPRMKERMLELFPNLQARSRSL
jgi:hypothetical protein